MRHLLKVLILSRVMFFFDPDIEAGTGRFNLLQGVPGGKLSLPSLRL